MLGVSERRKIKENVGEITLKFVDECGDTERVLGVFLVLNPQNGTQKHV